MAQEEPAPVAPTLVCEEDAHFSDWDFWVGEWRVTAGPNKDVFAGENSIRKIEKGCAIQENWTGTGGNTGQSINYYNPLTEKWRQVWVAPPGYLIDIEGGIVDGSMVLEGEISYYGQKTNFPFRGTWKPNQDGSVRQYFQQYSPDKKEWVDWFDGHYVRKADAASGE